MKHVLKHQRDTISGKQVLISGSGNVALYAAEKLLTLGAKVITLSDSKGLLHIPGGLTRALLSDIMTLRFKKHQPLANILQQHPDLSFHPGKTPWHMPADVALPCATENEIDVEDAKALCEGGVKAVVEGANMPVSPGAITVFKKHNVVYAPVKQPTQAALRCS